MNRLHTNTSSRPWRFRTLLIVCLCPPIVWSQAEPLQKSPSMANDMAITSLPTAKSTRSIWRNRVSLSPEDARELQSKQRLQETLRKLKAVRFEDFPEPVAQTVSEEPNVPVTETEPPLPRNTPTIIVRPLPPEAPNEVPMSASTLTKETAEALRLLAQSPEKLRKPETLGQILHKGKAWPEAALCYQESLKRLNAESVAPSEDKAWLLLQIGNCLQHSDPEEAVRIYKQLISEYPHSLWSELVRVKGQWITWELRDKPKTVITEIKENLLPRGKK